MPESGSHPHNVIQILAAALLVLLQILILILVLAKFFISDPDTTNKVQQRDQNLAFELVIFAYSRTRVTRNDHYEHYALIGIDSFSNLKMILGMDKIFKYQR